MQPAADGAEPHAAPRTEASVRAWKGPGGVWTGALSDPAPAPVDSSQRPVWAPPVLNLAPSPRPPRPPAPAPAPAPSAALPAKFGWGATSTP